MYTLNGKVVSNASVMDAIDDGTGKVKQGPALERVQHVENAAKKVISTNPLYCVTAFNQVIFFRPPIIICCAIF